MTGLQFHKNLAQGLSNAFGPDTSAQIHMTKAAALLQEASKLKIEPTEGRYNKRIIAPYQGVAIDGILGSEQADMPMIKHKLLHAVKVGQTLELDPYEQMTVRNINGGIVQCRLKLSALKRNPGFILGKKARLFNRETCVLTDIDPDYLAFVRDQDYGDLQRDRLSPLDMYWEPEACDSGMTNEGLYFGRHGVGINYIRLTCDGFQNRIGSSVNVEHFSNKILVHNFGLEVIGILE